MRLVQRVAVLMAVLLLAVSGAADEGVVHNTTTSAPDARYEIVQSGLAMRFTFRLDRWTGSISQLVEGSDEELVWEPMRIVALSAGQSQQRPRFQIFTSNLAARTTFLLDQSTGRTWQLMSTKQVDANGIEISTQAWFPVDE
jgi:hypothetical protein